MEFARPRARRLRMALPPLALMPCLEEDLADLGIDAFESCARSSSAVARRDVRDRSLTRVPRASDLRWSP